MTKVFVPPVAVRDIDDSELYNLALEMFYDSTTSQRFVEIVETLQKKDFDFNGLHSGDWTIGRKALVFGTPEPIEVLDRAGYNFAADSFDPVEQSKHLWHGSLHRTVATAAHRFDPTIEIPSLEQEARAEGNEMQRPSGRNWTTRIVVEHRHPNRGRQP